MMNFKSVENYEKMSSKDNHLLIEHYFPALSEQQKAQFAQLGGIYSEWNAKINVISRKDMDHFYDRHVLHSLALARFLNFADGSRILDVGTGGGFPGIPLAILFPACRFHLIDSIGKKIMVATEAVRILGLQNVVLTHENAKEERGRYDFIVCRAVMKAAELIKLTRNNVSSENFNPLHNGWLFLKGGDLDEEILELKSQYQIQHIADYFAEPFFETKKILYVPFHKK